MRQKLQHMQHCSSAVRRPGAHSHKPQLKHFTGEHLMEQKRTKSHRFHSCLLFFLKDRVRMEPENTKSKLKDLALKWFTETQAPLILHEGNFPAWFQGFISRKDAEDNLRDKELGCFLIRLSDKATGYILSYKGKDRCRHFVINQNKEGQFFVTGDTEMHDTLTSLIEYYKMSPIEPFGEYLSVSCFEQSSTSEYDVVHFEPKTKSGVSVEAIKKIWDQRAQQANQSQRPQTMPQKVIRIPQVSPVQEVPPVPKRGSPSKSNSLEEKSITENMVLYAQLKEPKPQERLKFTASSSLSPDKETESPQKARAEYISGTGTVYSELNLSDCRSISLPGLDYTSKEESLYRKDTPTLHPHWSPNPENVKAKTLSSKVESSHSLDMLSDKSLYQLAGKPANPKDMMSNAMYAEVPCEPVQRYSLLDNTYEQIPVPHNTADIKACDLQGNTYETLEDIKQRSSESGKGIKSDKWKWLLPEQWKK